MLAQTPFVRAVLVAGLALLSACGVNDLNKPPVPLGDFVLGINVATAEGVQVPGISRKVTEEEWKTAIEAAMQERFGRYEGSRIYNFAVRVDGYVLAPPGIPVVASPRSALIVTVFVFDDATQTLLNPEGKQLTMLEEVSPQSFLGSGLTQTKIQQMNRMAGRAALAIQRYLVDNPEWFDLPPLPVAPTEEGAAAAELPVPAQPPEAAPLPDAGAVIN